MDCYYYHNYYHHSDYQFTFLFHLTELWGKYYKHILKFEGHPDKHHQSSMGWMGKSQHAHIHPTVWICSMEIGHSHHRGSHVWKGRIRPSLTLVPHNSILAATSMLTSTDSHSVLATWQLTRDNQNNGCVYHPLSTFRVWHFQKGEISKHDRRKQT